VDAHQMASRAELGNRGGRPCNLGFRAHRDFSEGGTLIPALQRTLRTRLSRTQTGSRWMPSSSGPAAAAPGLPPGCGVVNEHRLPVTNPDTGVNENSGIQLGPGCLKSLTVPCKFAAHLGRLPLRPNGCGLPRARVITSLCSSPGRIHTALGITVFPALAASWSARCS